MGCFDDEDRELDEAAKPYLEPLIDALESNWNTVSSNGIYADGRVGRAQGAHAERPGRPGPGGLRVRV